MNSLKNRILLTIVSLSTALIAFAHPFYVSITSIDYNAKNKRIEISCRLFYDDLEVALKNQTGKKIDVINPKNKAVADSAISRYIQHNLKLAINNQNKNLKFVGYEIEEDVAWCYLEVQNINDVNKIEIVNQLLYRDFKSQSNIMHLKVNNMKKSTKLDNPKRTASFSF